MESNHVFPRYQRGAVTVWLMPLDGVDAGGLEPPTFCVSCRCATACATRRWWSQERSNLLLPGFNRPLHRQSLRTMRLLENRANEGVGFN